MISKIDNVEVIYPDEMKIEEVTVYLQEQQELNPKIRMTRLAIEFDHNKENVYLHPTYDTITRTRRITGYLSNLKKFNDAKQAEANDRVTHFDDKLMNEALRDRP